MGIKDINNFINARIKKGELKDTVELRKLSGKTIAIDFANYLFRLKARIQKTEVEKMDFEYSKGWSEVNYDIISERLYEHFINCLIAFKKQKIEIICVEDGMYPDEKKETQEKRKDVKRKLQEKLEISKQEKGSLVDYKAHIKNNVFLSSKERYICMELCKYYGQKVYIADGEAEQLCAQLCKNGEVFAVLSNDTDLYAFDCPNIITAIFNETRSDAKVDVLVLDDMYSKLFNDIQSLNKLTPELVLKAKKIILLCICIMCGNDYVKRIKNMGTERIYNAIKKAFFVTEDKKFPDVGQLINFVCEDIPEFNAEDYSFVLNLFQSEITYKEKDFDINDFKFDEIFKHIEPKLLIE